MKHQATLGDRKAKLPSITWKGGRKTNAREKRKNLRFYWTSFSNKAGSIHTLHAYLHVILL